MSDLHWIWSIFCCSSSTSCWNTQSYTCQKLRAWRIKKRILARFLKEADDPPGRTWFKFDDQGKQRDHLSRSAYSAVQTERLIQKVELATIESHTIGEYVHVYAQSTKKWSSCINSVSKLDHSHILMNEQYNRRSNFTRLKLAKPRTNALKRSFCYHGAKASHNLPTEL